jgi:uncharacterized delta-60 repeat protein
MLFMASGCPAGGNHAADGSLPTLADGGSPAVTHDGGIGATPDAYTGPGSLDDSFGDHGLALPSVVGCPTSMIVEADDRLLVALTDGRVARFDANGSLDPTFGVGGVSVLPDPSPYVTRLASNMVVLPDSRIVLALSAVPQAGYELVALVRYLADGSPDLSLGGRGIAFLSLDPTGPQQPVALATWSGPKGLSLVIGGMPTQAEGGTGPLVIRTDLEGVPDSTFANGQGWTAPQLGVGSWSTSAMAVEPGGGIVLAGYAFMPSKENDFGIVRINQDGTWDQHFGQTGLATLAFAGNAENRALSIAMLPDTTFLVAGFTMCLGSLCLPNFAMARYYADGTLDTSFGQQGKVIVANGGAQALAVVQGGAIVMAGFDLVNEIVDLGGGWGRGSPQTFALARLSAAGVLDPTFGMPSPPNPPGVVQTSFGDALTRASISAVATQSTGTLVAAGCVGAYAGGDSHVGIASYRP